MTRTVGWLTLAQIKVAGKRMQLLWIKPMDTGVADCRAGEPFPSILCEMVGSINNVDSTNSDAARKFGPRK